MRLLLLNRLSFGALGRIAPDVGYYVGALDLAAAACSPMTGLFSSARGAVRPLTLRCPGPLAGRPDFPVWAFATVVLTLWQSADASFAAHRLRAKEPEDDRDNSHRRVPAKR